MFNGPARGYLVRESRPGTQARGAHFTTYSEFDALGVIYVEFGDERLTPYRIADTFDDFLAKIR